MKRFLTTLVLAALLLTLPAAAVAETQPVIARTKTYDGQFSDLAADSVFYDNVSALYEFGLSQGRSDGTYGLTDSMTLGQMVIFSSRILSLYQGEDAEAGAQRYAEVDATVEEPYRTYLPYLCHLQTEGGLELDWSDGLHLPATRAQVAHLLASTLPEGTLPAINDAAVTEGYASRRYLQDVTEYTPYHQDILALYRQGVCIGVDADGTFLPDEPITRGAAAAMLTRMVDPSLRQTLRWGTVVFTSAAGTTMADLIAPGTYVAAPETDEEFDETVRHMLSENRSTLQLRYDTISAVEARTVMHRALAAAKRYCEQSYNQVSCTFTLSGELTLQFSSTSKEESSETFRATAMEQAIAVHDALWQEGYLQPDMTQHEIALMYYAWVCSNCEYDEGATETSVSHLPYGLFTHGLAVCDGYTGAYNLLLKLEGISCYGLSQDDHIWTVAELDGETVHIDTTWGDVGEGGSTAFFAMTEEQSFYYHQIEQP